MTLAAQFSLPDQDGRIHQLSDYRGQWLVLYFYPKDDTPGCTIEACSFRDEYDYLQEKGLQVLGVSADSVASHKKFATKHKLHFPLLADTDKTTIQAYGAWAQKSMFGKKYMGILRKTLLIGPDGLIVREYPKVTPLGHAVQILQDFESAKAEA
jgi:thioredoxin-dependent peroxiredoxin